MLVEPWGGSWPSSSSFVLLHTRDGRLNTRIPEALGCEDARDVWVLRESEMNCLVNHASHGKQE